MVQYDQEKNEHIVTIKFKLPVVKDKIDYKDPDDKGKGYSIKKGKEKLVGSVIPTPRGKKSVWSDRHLYDRKDLNELKRKGN